MGPKLGGGGGVTGGSAKSPNFTFVFLEAFPKLQLELKLSSIIYKETSLKKVVLSHLTIAPVVCLVICFNPIPPY